MYQIASIKHKRPLIFLIFLLLVVNTIYFILNTSVANASFSFGIYPPIATIELTQNEPVTIPITVKNFDSQSYAVSIILQPFVTETENGQVSYLTNIPPAAYQALFNNVTIAQDNNQITKTDFAPGEEKTLILHIAPDDAIPFQDYYFSVLFVSQAQADNNQRNTAVTSGGIGMNVILSYGKPTKALAKIVEFSTPELIDHGPVQFSVRVKNTGEKAFKPKGEILITNMFGQTIGKVELLPVTILKGSTRMIPDKDSIKRTANTSNYALWPESFLLGPYTAKLTISFDQVSKPLTQTTHFAVFPTKILIQASLVLLLTVFVLSRIRKRLS